MRLHLSTLRIIQCDRCGSGVTRAVYDEDVRTCDCGKVRITPLVSQGKWFVTERSV